MTAGSIIIVLFILRGSSVTVLAELDCENSPDESACVNSSEEDVDGLLDVVAELNSPLSACVNSSELALEEATVLVVSFFVVSGFTDSNSLPGAENTFGLPLLVSTTGQFAGILELLLNK